MSPTFRALRIRNYRLYATGALVSNIGTWMQRVAQDWLVLTSSPASAGVALGITTGLQFLPMLLLAPFAGVIADRYPKRTVLMSPRRPSGLPALSLGLLASPARSQLWHVYVLAFAARRRRRPSTPRPARRSSSRWSADDHAAQRRRPQQRRPSTSPG